MNPLSACTFLPLPLIAAIAGGDAQPSLSCAALAPFLLWPGQEKADLESQAEGPHRHSELKDGERVGTCRLSSLTQLRGGGCVANILCDSG